MQRKKRILTGDRPTGQLHLGHYVGTLKNRVRLQDEYDCFFIIADLQVLTDHLENHSSIESNVFEVMCDYLGVGLKPENTFFVQSQVPELAELTMYFSFLVTLPRLQRNPTVKEEIKQRGFGESIPAGFFVYPVSQAADITVVKASLVPVGNDQLPMIEQTNEIVRAFNRTYNTDILVEAQALVPKCARLIGLDGKSKMSKSLNNAIFLSDDADTLKKRVMSMYTDPGHIHVNDPGKVEGNVVFSYLDVFDPDTQKVQELKDHYQRGGLGDVKIKMYLFEVLNDLLDPIRKRRQEFAKDQGQVMRMLLEGTERTRQVAAITLREVKDALKLVEVR